MDASLRSGSRLGRYELLVELGRGGMASVWIAREPSEMGDEAEGLDASEQTSLSGPATTTGEPEYEDGDALEEIDDPGVPRR